MMPVASEWFVVFLRAAPHERVRTTWRQVAAEGDASLLDCSSAMPDEAFRSADHLTPDGARTFSERMASWLVDGATPSGCTIVP